MNKKGTKKRAAKPKEMVVWKKYPVPRSFMLFGMIGLLITIFYTNAGAIPLDFGVAMGIVFFIMIGASLRSLMP